MVSERTELEKWVRGNLPAAVMYDEPRWSQPFVERIGKLHWQLQDVEHRHAELEQRHMKLVVAIHKHFFGSGIPEGITAALEAEVGDENG